MPFQLANFRLILKSFIPSFVCARLHLLSRFYETIRADTTPAPLSRGLPSATPPKLGNRFRPVIVQINKQTNKQAPN